MIFHIAGPSSPPTNFRLVATGADTISASWSPPPVGSQNGDITAYNFTCQPDTSALAFPVTYPAAGIYSLSGFSPATMYNCSLFASTAGGSGPSVYQTVTLLDGGKYTHWYFC